MDSRMQTRECSGLHDRGKGVKTAESPVKLPVKIRIKIQTHSKNLFNKFLECVITNRLQKLSRRYSLCRRGIHAAAR